MEVVRSIGRHVILRLLERDLGGSPDMHPLRHQRMRADPVGAGILLITTFEPLTIDAIIEALRDIGAPDWWPASEVIIGTIERLLGQRLLCALETAREHGSATDRMRVRASAEARGRLPAMLMALPLSGSPTDIAYKLKVLGLDVLNGGARATQHAELVEHWRNLVTQWRNAEERAPALRACAQRWRKRRVIEARRELGWLECDPMANPTE